MRRSLQRPAVDNMLNAPAAPQSASFLFIQSVLFLNVPRVKIAATSIMHVLVVPSNPQGDWNKVIALDCTYNLASARLTIQTINGKNIGEEKRSTSPSYSNHEPSKWPAQERILNSIGCD